MLRPKNYRFHLFRTHCMSTKCMRHLPRSVHTESSVPRLGKCYKHTVSRLPPRHHFSCRQHCLMLLFGMTAHSLYQSSHHLNGDLVTPTTRTEIKTNRKCARMSSSVTVSDTRWTDRQRRQCLTGGCQRHSSGTNGKASLAFSSPSW